MARLHEYQGKAILAANGFKIPRGRAVSTADDAIAVAKELAAEKKAAEVVIKIQAWTTGRAGIGGVAFAKKPADVRGHAARMLARRFRRASGDWGERSFIRREASQTPNDARGLPSPFHASTNRCRSASSEGTCTSTVTS